MGWWQNIKSYSLTIFILRGIVPLRLHMDHASAPMKLDLPNQSMQTSILSIFQIKMYTGKYFTLFIEYECVNPLLYSHVSSDPLSTQFCAIVKPQLQCPFLAPGSSS